MYKLDLTTNPHIPASTTSMGIIDRIVLATFFKGLLEEFLI